MIMTFCEERIKKRWRIKWKKFFFLSLGILGGRWKIWKINKKRKKTFEIEEKEKKKEKINEWKKNDVKEKTIYKGKEKMKKYKNLEEKQSLCSRKRVEWRKMFHKLGEK